MSDVTRRRADGAASIAAEVDCLEADAASGNAAAAAAEQSKAALSAGVEMIHGGRVLCKASMKVMRSCPDLIFETSFDSYLGRW